MRRKVNPPTIPTRNDEGITPAAGSVNSQCLRMSSDGKRLRLLGCEGEECDEDGSTCEPRCHSINHTRRGPEV